MKKGIYFENLDGLRFLCFLSVFFFHSFYTELAEIKNTYFYHFIKRDFFNNGILGVNFFFVLSGFLITYLLLEEKKLNSKINLKSFWVRRILRIWPLFYFCVFFGFIIFPFIKEAFGRTPHETAHVIYYVTFLNNFDFIRNDLPDASILGVLWSVAIEEQFYLIWPLVLFFIPLKKLWIPFFSIFLISMIFRAVNDSYILNEFHTLSCIGDMVIGATGAWLIIISKRFKSFIEQLHKLTIFSIYILFLLIYFFRDKFLFSNYTIRIFERPLIAIVIILIILEQSFSKNSLFKMGQFKYFTKLGKISYGLYCLHFIGILISINITRMLHLNTKLWQVIILETFISLGLSILISWMSYSYYEYPFLKLKERFSYITKNQNIT